MHPVRANHESRLLWIRGGGGNTEGKSLHSERVLPDRHRFARYYNLKSITEAIPRGVWNFAYHPQKIVAQGEKMNNQLLSTSRVAVAAPVTKPQAKARMDGLAFHAAMRKLWQDYLTWTRFVIIGVFEELPDLITWTRYVIAGAFEDVPDLDPTVQRLLQNREDLGDAVKPFYGDAAGEQLTRLFADHILMAAQVFQAAKSRDTAAQNDALERWYENADSIALFLNGANPNHWSLEELRARMREHLDLTLNEAVAYFGGNYKVSIAAYDAVHLQAREIADMLSEGIIRQFPNEFGRGGNN